MDNKQDIEREIKKLDIKQYAIKIIINSIYGAFGNKYFMFHNVDIAQTITLQGQDLIKFAMAALNHYFKNKWHVDTDLHAILGIGSNEIHPISDDVVIYGDTDSTYITFEPAIDSVTGLVMDDKQAVLFCKSIIDNRLTSFLNNAFDVYSKNFNTKNQMNFKLESISSSAIWLAKKNYVLKIQFKKKILDAPSIEAKGIDYAKPSVPKWARDRIGIIMNKILDVGYDISIEKDIVPMLVEYRQTFHLNDIDVISYNYNLTKYDDYIVNVEDFDLKSGTPIRARAASYYNNLLMQSGIKKYNKIRQKDKIKFYYAKNADDPEHDVFAYLPTNYPMEFAIPVDYDEQFYRLMVEPINKILEAMRMHQMNKHFRREIKVVMPKSKDSSAGVYQLFAVDSVSLNNVAVPEFLNKYIIDSEKSISDNVIDDYVAYVTKYGISTEIVAGPALDKYRHKKIMDNAKKLHDKMVDELPPFEAKNFEDACNELKCTGYKTTIDENTGELVVFRKKNGTTFTIKKENMMMSRSMDDYIVPIVKFFENELNEEESARLKKAETQAKKIQRDAAKTNTKDQDLLMTAELF